jgi:hypothetical protein
LGKTTIAIWGDATACVVVIVGTSVAGIAVIAVITGMEI